MCIDSLFNFLTYILRANLVLILLDFQSFITYTKKMELKRPALYLVDEQILIKTFPLEGREYIIGRADTCDIVLNSKEVSRRHSRISFENGRYVIEDLNSTNGTEVNGQRIERQILQHGDEITTGDITLIFDDGSGIMGLKEETQCEKPGEETKSLSAHFDQVIEKTRDRSTAEAVKKMKTRLLRGREELKRAAYLDRLTGIYNRRFFDDEILKRLEIAKKTTTPLSLIFIDIDFFKKVNDTHGHDKGDEVLKKTARLIQHACRQDDVVARYGGEEFVVLFSNMTLSNALNAAESIRKIIEEQTPALLQMKITVSIGVATYPNQAKDSAELIKKADQALYQAKNSGRNRVAVSNG